MLLATSSAAGFDSPPPMAEVGPPRPTRCGGENKNGSTVLTRVGDELNQESFR